MWVQICPLHPRPLHYCHAGHWFQWDACCDISAAHWEVIRTMNTSIQKKSEDRERKCWHVWGELCQALKMCPGKHMYDGGLWVHTGCFLLKQVMCCAVAGENASSGHVLLPSLALGLGQVHSSCLSPWANNRHTHTHKYTPRHVSQMCQIRGNITTGSGLKCHPFTWGYYDSNLVLNFDTHASAQIVNHTHRWIYTQ